MSGSTSRGAVALAAVAALGTPSCFFFNSQWLEPKPAQVAAQHATPSELRATPEGGASAEGAKHVLRLRARATPRYAAEVGRWPEQLAAQIDDANRILAPTLGARLELAATETWAPRGNEDDDVEGLVDDLTTADPGQGVDCVLGLAGSSRRVEWSFHKLGAARLLGKHLVVRAIDDAKEYDAIERNLADLGEEERRKLFRERKRHKVTTLLLHELGHALGAPHQPEATTIMHPTYGPKVEGYSEAAAGLMRLSLEQRLRPGARGEPAFAKAMIEHLERTSASWVAADREVAIERLRPAASGTAQGVAASPRPGGAPDTKGDASPAAGRVEGLNDADQAVYAQAQQERAGGHLNEAWAKAESLFQRHLKVYEVQELRCQLAMQRGGPMQQVTSHCERLLKLTEEMTKRPHPK